MDNKNANYYEFFFVFLGFALGGESALCGLLAVSLPIRISKFYDIFRQKAHGFNRGMNATCM